MPLTFSSLLGWTIYENETAITAFSTMQWGLFFLVTILTMAFALTPTTVIALVSGYFLGYFAIFPLLITYSLASIIGYYISTPLGKRFHTTLHEAYPTLDQLIEKTTTTSPSAFAFFCRISPILPFAVMNVVLPFIGIKFKPFFWGGMAGMLPRTTLAVVTGSVASNLVSIMKHPNNTSYMQIGFAVLLVISIFGFILLFKRFTKV